MHTAKSRSEVKFVASRIKWVVQLTKLAKLLLLFVQMRRVLVAGSQIQNEQGRNVVLEVLYLRGFCRIVFENAFP